jgi:hypothetical protein
VAAARRSYASEFDDHLSGVGDPPRWWPYAREYPGWHVWEGVSGLLYARRPRTSPPMVVRTGSGADGLRGEIQAAENARRR